jgi:hypothetical protein
MIQAGAYTKSRAHAARARGRSSAEEQEPGGKPMELLATEENRRPLAHRSG